MKEFAPLLFRAEEKLLGTWHSHIESPMGIQTYHFQFSVKDGQPIAKATVDGGNQQREVEFSEVKLNDTSISFAELRKFGDREMRIDYTGVVDGKNLAITRSFANRGAQEAVATRHVPAPIQELSTPPVVEVKIDKTIKECLSEIIFDWHGR